MAVKYPEKRFKAGRGISTSVWKHESNDNGKQQARFSIGIQKSYRDKSSDEWKQSKIFVSPQDVHPLITALQKAYETCVLTEKSEN